MFKYFYDNNIIIYTYGGLCGLGILIRFIVNLVYKSLVKESDKLGDTKNKKLKQMKMKFEACFKLRIGVNNVDTFVDKNVLKYRYCGLLLSTWDNFCGQILFLNLLAVPVLAVFGVIYKCGQDQILLTGAVGISTSALLILVDKSINLSGKRKMLKVNLMDYFENFCKVRLEEEPVNPEVAALLRREIKQSADVNKQISAALAEPIVNDKDELNRRREARRRKEEEKKLQVEKREEELKKAEEARKEEERVRAEEKKLAAAKRREEERLKLEEDQQALEARRVELKQKAIEKQQALELKKQREQENEIILHNIEEDLKPSEDKTDIEMLMEGLEEIAAEKEKKIIKSEKEKQDKDKPGKAVSDTTPKKKTSSRAKTKVMSDQEEKVIEDVLKEFFA